MEEVFRLLEEEHIHSAIEYIYEKLKEKDSKGEFVEDLINHLNKLNEKSEIIFKTIFPSLLKLIGIDNDVLRYSLLLSLKSLSESDPEFIVPFAKEYLSSKNGNAREGMIQLLTFAANTDPKKVKSLIDDGQIIELLADKDDFVQKKTIDLLRAVGKKYALDIEKKLIERVQSTTNKILKDNAEKVLKSLVDIKKLESEGLEKKQLEVKVKVLESKEKQVTEEEVKIKEDEIRTREVIVSIKKESEMKNYEIIAKEKELIEKEQALKVKTLNLKEADLILKEKEKEIEAEKIRHKADQLEKEIEITRKRAELDIVKKELEIKEIEKEKQDIIKEEKKRLKERLHKMGEDDDEGFEELNLD